MGVRKDLERRRGIPMWFPLGRTVRCLKENLVGEAEICHTNMSLHYGELAKELIIYQSSHINL